MSCHGRRTSWVTLRGTLAIAAVERRQQAPDATRIAPSQMKRMSGLYLERGKLQRPWPRSSPRAANRSRAAPTSMPASDSAFPPSYSARFCGLRTVTASPSRDTTTSASTPA